MCPFKSKAIARPSTKIKLKQVVWSKGWPCQQVNYFIIDMLTVVFHNCQTIIYAPDWLRFLPGFVYLHNEHTSGTTGRQVMLTSPRKMTQSLSFWRSMLLCFALCLLYWFLWWFAVRYCHCMIKIHASIYKIHNAITGFNSV